MSSGARPGLNTLSSLRTRTIPKTIDLGSLTLNLEQAAAKARSSSNPNVKKQFQPNRLSSLLERMSSKAPGSKQMTASPLGGRQKEKSVVNPEESSKLNASRARLRLPDPLRGSGRSSPSKPASEFTRPVSSLDRLAAESGVDSSTASIRARRNYKSRLQARPASETAQVATRFSLPRKSGPGAARAARKPSSKAAPGQLRERKQSRAQEEESARQAAIQARKTASRPQPVPFSYDGLNPAEFSPVLRAIHANGSKTVYRKFQGLLKDERDAVRLVVGNKSIVNKGPVLDTIETWIPSPESVSKEARA